MSGEWSLNMDIASMSISMSLANVQQQVSISMLKKSMDTQEASMQNLLSSMSPPVVQTPSYGSHIDVYI